MSHEKLKREISTETQAVHSGHTDVPSRDVVPPIYPATTFERAGDGSYPGHHMYARISSPAYEQAESLLRTLENGYEALLFSSGMAAGSALLQALQTGDRILAPQFMYWGFRGWIKRFAEDWGLGLGFYENPRLDDLEKQLCERPTKLLLIETPANPTWELTDIRAASELAHRHGALVAVDSTAASPVLSQPLSLGADVVLHSATKYLNGHSDVIAGVLVTRADNAFWQRVRSARTNGGAIPGAFEAWLLMRGMRTLFVRVRTASANALTIAQALQKHPEVSRVLYPGLPDHAGHAIAQKQMKGGFGGMLSVRFAGGQAKAQAVAARLRVFKQATSLGSVESLVEHRASVEGAGTFCPDDLLRFSIGIEPVDDLLADLYQAIES
ncbi:MAG: PLP-dependent aspartate aminotransferase family protein [Candidatus Accumulibacter sp.]|jgi:cystathionine gamma-synthase|nr:PLP-dependent aspartate aminotransferase family protein [Accumulibacter sp.]